MTFEKKGKVDGVAVVVPAIDEPRKYQNLRIGPRRTKKGDARY
jgi:hypothetical protein